MKLEQFSLVELKDIIRFIQKRYFLLLNYKIYHLNKYDIIVILRNSKLLNETNASKLIIEFDNIKPLELIPKPKKRAYKGTLMKGGIQFIQETRILNFN